MRREVVTNPLRVLDVFYVFRVSRKFHFLKQFAAAIPFVSAFFAIAHQKDIFQESFFVSKSAPASFSLKLRETSAWLLKQKLATQKSKSFCF